jgi:glutathione S-transferase
VKLYAILGSHACRTATLMLEHKGIAYEHVCLPTAWQPIMLPLLGFPGATRGRLTVPALSDDGRRLVGNPAIARYLDELRPEPSLLPADPDARQAVEAAEEWGYEVLQIDARRLALALGLRGREGVAAASRGPLGPLLFRRPRARALGVRLPMAVFNVNRRSEARLLARLPAELDRVDAWIADGTLNGEQLNVADFVIAPCLALLAYRPDVRPELDRRPAGRLLRRLLG